MGARIFFRFLIFGPHAQDNIGGGHDIADSANALPGPQMSRQALKVSAALLALKFIALLSRGGR
jgi:hypothetical protein